jgi:homogentisate 1,2-dioxygenase
MVFISLVFFFLFSSPLLFGSEKYSYLSGFGNQFSSEAIPNALPQNQNNPQVPPYGLYAEQLSGTSFTTPRNLNQRTWLYRIRPSVLQGSFRKIQHSGIKPNFTSGGVTPDPLRWPPFAFPKEVSVDFIDGLKTLGGSGDPAHKVGLAIHIYAANTSMNARCFYNSDGDFLIVPQEGGLDIQTECGYLRILPGEICVIPRGIRYRVDLIEEKARGYVCEIFNGHFTLPELGPIGANGLANPRDFLYPIAAYEDIETSYIAVNKFCGELFEADLPFSPFDVVAFHGNYLPFKYTLSNFCAMNSVSFDHPDPSIFTVLSCPSSEPGVALVDFVIFPPRWSCAEHTFRPPYFHRNCMSEFMGLIKGAYEAKTKGFLPGGASLHQCMTPHGPESAAVQHWSYADLSPAFIQKDTLAFMFETSLILKLSEWALEKDNLDLEYRKCWETIESRFPKY